MKRNHYIPVLITFIWLLCNSIPTIGHAQKDSVKTTHYLASYWYNGWALLGSPLKWQADDWAKFTATSIVTGLCLSMDDAISDPLFQWQDKQAVQFGKTGDVIGHVTTQIGLSALSIGIGELTKNKKLTHFGLDNLQSQLYIGGLTFVVKELTHRARPYTGLDKFSFSGPFKNKDHESFYSAHAAFAFGTATTLFLHSKKNVWVGLGGYAVATGVALSRVQQQKHWVSDVFLGAVVGSAVSTFVYNQQEKRRHQKQLLKPLP